MNHKFHSLLGAAAFGVLGLLASCEMDQLPESSLRDTDSWTSESDVQNYYNGLLAGFRSASGNAANTSEAMTDLFNLTQNSPSSDRLQAWTFTAADLGGGTWGSNYALIGSANHILNNMQSVTAAKARANAPAAGTFDLDNFNRNMHGYRGTAFLARAYAYATMVTRYCVNYQNAAQAEKALGLPLVYTIDLDNKPARASLADTYKQIHADLDSAEVHLAASNIREGDLITPGLSMLTALRARVLLNERRFDEAIAAAEKVMENYSLITNSMRLASMWSEDVDGGEIIYQPPITLNSRELYMNYGSFISNRDGRGFNMILIPTQGLYDLYDPSDYRRSIYFTEATVVTSLGASDGPVYYFSKFPGRKDVKSAVGNQYAYYNATKAFRLAEMFLIAAEASLFKGSRDEAAAIGYLRTLRKARGLSNAKSEFKTTGTALDQDMKEEWIREFAGEGLRLDCLKRWGDGFKRMPAQKNAVSEKGSILVTSGGVLDTEVKAADQRFVWEIPVQDLKGNPNLQRNWMNIVVE